MHKFNGIFLRVVHALTQDGAHHLDLLGSPRMRVPHPRVLQDWVLRHCQSSLCPVIKVITHATTAHTPGSAVRATEKTTPAL